MSEGSAERAQRARLERYQRLVERKHLRALTPAETREMEQLGRQVDRYYDPFYERVVKRLRGER